MKDGPKNFCSFPFRSVFTLNHGSIKMCCDSTDMGNLNSETLPSAWNNQTWTEVRRAFLRDERHPACNQCWKKEEAGLISARDDDGQSKKWQALSDGTGVIQSGPQTLSVRLGNSCNLKCIMCHPFNSTKWNEDADIYETHIGSLKTAARQPKILGDDWLLESLRNCRNLTFIGGEPLIIKSHEKILQHLVNSGRAAQMTLRYYSNVSVLPEWCTNYWQHFEKIVFAASIDGVGPVYNYIRHPGDWDNVARNLQHLDQLGLPNLEFTICYVFMNLNALDLENLFRWRENTPWKNTAPVIRPDCIEEPAFFLPHLLNSIDKNRVQESLENILHNFIRHPHEDTLVRNMALLLKRENPQKKARMGALKAYLEALDRRRCTNFRRVFNLASFEDSEELLMPRINGHFV